MNHDYSHKCSVYTLLNRIDFIHFHRILMCPIGFFFFNFETGNWIAGQCKLYICIYCAHWIIVVIITVTHRYAAFDWRWAERRHKKLKRTFLVSIRFRITFARPIRFAGAQFIYKFLKFSKEPFNWFEIVAPLEILSQFFLFAWIFMCFHCVLITQEVFLSYLPLYKDVTYAWIHFFMCMCVNV